MGPRVGRGRSPKGQQRGEEWKDHRARDHSPLPVALDTGCKGKGMEGTSRKPPPAVTTATWAAFPQWGNRAWGRGQPHQVAPQTLVSLPSTSLSVLFRREDGNLSAGLAARTKDEEKGRAGGGGRSSLRNGQSTLRLGCVSPPRGGGGG